MLIVSQLVENLKHLEEKIFILRTNLEPLLLSGSISNDLESLINNPLIKDLFDKTTNDIDNLTEILEPVAKCAKKSTKQYKSDKTVPYANFIVDEPPIVGNPKEKIDYKEVLSASEKRIKPVNRRVALEYKGVCVHCGAPNGYIYKHSKTQHMCKVCKSTFTQETTRHDEIVHRCPHCANKLQLQHNRSNYAVLKCPNDKCSFYIRNKRHLAQGKADHLKTNTNCYKLRYYFRLFDFSMTDILNNLPFTINSKVNIDKIYHSKYTLGLILTFYVNYGLSSRKTAKIMAEIFNIIISHQTVVNYSEAVSGITEVLNDSYQYELSDTVTFDETYIKVKGKHHYVFFGSDTDKKIITSYRIFPNRDTKNAVITLSQTFEKYKELPEQLNVVADGNPIYNAAQVYFKMYGINFDLYQAIGVKNKDEVSKNWRPYKQAEERLNRTYKQNYHGTNGYGSLRNANVYMSLYVAFFNFLRTHSSLNYHTPISIESIENERLMPNKWLKLMDYTLNTYQVQC